ncbi:MAG TPA: maleylpyruvate isomerase N-terminal domain-containing protein [Micromonosporaceae bacterium]|nr:maleylpyruvate isomerase N-terminal domain-containing protein [Micromonosporaceae bacterium]
MNASATAVREAFHVEAALLSSGMSGLGEADFDRPTRCTPWAVRDLLAHVCVGAGRLLPMLAESAPPHATVDAPRYFAAEKFEADTDTARIQGAQRAAAEATSGRMLAGDLDRVGREVCAALASVPSDRVVRTRHGDAMTVTEFLKTRVVELGVHGLDLAAAMNRPPWLSSQAAAVIVDVLADDHERPVRERLGWDRRMLIEKTTGRAPITDDERLTAERLGLRWLTFG